MIRITRRKEGTDHLKAYKIYINGVCYGEIWRGKTRELTVKNGEHTVYVSRKSPAPPLLPWGREYGSNLLHVVVNDSIVDLEVGIALTGWKFWLWPYSDIFIRKNEYLLLKEKEACEPQKDGTE